MKVFVVKFEESNGQEPFGRVHVTGAYSSRKAAEAAIACDNAVLQRLEGARGSSFGNFTIDEFELREE